MPQVLRRQLFKSDYQYRWDPELALDQWWIDALTVDPLELLQDRRVIWTADRPQPVLQTKVENASVGTMPAVAAYLAVHAKFGTHVFFPYHGAKHGGDDKEADGKMYEGFIHWHARVSEDVRDFIKHRDYYNQEKGMERFGANAGRSRKQRMEGAYDPHNFLVRARGLVLLPPALTTQPRGAPR